MFGEASGHREGESAGGGQPGRWSVVATGLARRTRRSAARRSDQDPAAPTQRRFAGGCTGLRKSLSAKAIASEWRLPLYRLDMASILGMYVGMSESRLEEALLQHGRPGCAVRPVGRRNRESARRFERRGLRGHAAVNRPIPILAAGIHVEGLMVATSNDVSSLPPELLRKGLFDELFFVDLPELDRAEIIRLYFDKYLHTAPDEQHLDELVACSEGFAGSDLEWVVHQIASAAFRSNQTTPSREFITAKFASVMPFSRTNPEEVAAIRAWGKERAMPAGRIDSMDAHSSGSGPRRVVLTNSSVALAYGLGSSRPAVCSSDAPANAFVP